ncbi:putative fungal-specific transcription factor domain protein [Rhypophila decipiens]|uniref:Fungal-specific transcription factor domain protein n=1 Tax=Rhypophila decipiens TaxID=261697 RepID=A0AAN7B3H9_9PEZI|nr:putative fungal-specific transcription factor domain protein [Rhypophila decipiens]
MSASSKRPSSEMDVPGATRSKRSKYSSIACEECRKSKLKCNALPGGLACDRCIDRAISCNRSRPQHPEVDVRLEKFEHELNLLRRQVADLTSSHDTNNSPPSSMPQKAAVDDHVEPHFVGTTRPAFNLKMAKASLAHLVDAGDDNQSEIEPYPSGDQAIDGETERPLCVKDAQRLVATFRHEVQTVYPILDPTELDPYRIPQLLSQIQLRTKDHSQSRPIVATSDERESQLLRAVIATTLILDRPSTYPLHRQLISSVESEITSLSAHTHVNLQTIRIMAVLAIYHFFRDQDLYAWRTIGIAARLALEMGLHRKESLLEAFPDPQARASALSVFWCVYVLDRQFGLQNGLSFALVDRDIDPELVNAAPDIPPTLQSLITYGRLCTQVWEATPQFLTHQAPSFSLSSSSHIANLDTQIQSWLATTLSLSSSPLTTLTLLRANHLRLLIHRPSIISTTAIHASPQLAHLTVSIAQNTTRSIVLLSKESNIYARQQAAYNHFLVSALGIMLLAVSHAPAMFAQACREDFEAAVELVEGVREGSGAGRRLWRSICGLVKAVRRLGLGSGSQRGEGGSEGSGDGGLGMSVWSGWDDFFGMDGYGMQRQPDMMMAGGDLMGLFDAFGQGELGAADGAAGGGRGSNEI